METSETLCTMFLHISDAAEVGKHKPFSKVNKRSVAPRLQRAACGTSVAKWGTLKHLIRAFCWMLNRANLGGGRLGDVLLGLEGWWNWLLELFQSFDWLIERRPCDRQQHCFTLTFQISFGLLRVKLCQIHSLCYAFPHRLTTFRYQVVNHIDVQPEAQTRGPYCGP